MKLFVAHRIDVYDLSTAIFVGTTEAEEVREYTLEELLNYPHEIISYDLKHFLNQFRKIYHGKLPVIIDVEQIIKINTGRSRKSYPKKKYPWMFWNRINRELGESEAKRLYEIVRSGKDNSEIICCLKLLTHQLKVVYFNSIEGLNKSMQLTRFYDLENRVQQILNKRQVEGILIDEVRLTQILSSLENQNNILINQLRYKYKIISLDQNYLRNFLNEYGFKISNKDVDQFSLLSFLSGMKMASNLCHDIHEALRVKHDYERLRLYIVEEHGLIYPEFNCVGTVTARILINFPSIQNLKKENRIIFKPKEGYTFLYCDFNQFEPGILASMCKDEEMLKLYNSSDIYASFSEYLFESSVHRKEAKILFLSYIYGMSNKKLIALIDSVIKSKAVSSTKSASQFFSKFQALDKFRRTEIRKAMNLGYIQSETSFRRYIRKQKDGIKGQTSESRFVLSQLIQGTASYILKKAILEVSKDESIEFMIPMHDAVLYQVPLDLKENKKKYIEKCFIDKFTEVCPDIRATVDFKAFEE